MSWNHACLRVAMHVEDNDGSSFGCRCNAKGDPGGNVGGSALNVSTLAMMGGLAK